MPTCATLDNPLFGGLVTASNECGNVPVTCQAGPITIVGCSFSQVFTFTAEACGLTNTTTSTRTFTWTNCGSIGNFVWSDRNNNGIQDGGEPGIAGVTVTLTGCGLSLTTTTDVNGAYLFSNLPPCTYTVTFGTPTGYTPSPANQGLNDAIDSDPIGGAVSVPLALGENNTTVDAGFFLPGSIGNFVWSDNNNNGIQDGGEPGIAGVTVTLTGCGLSLTTTTDVNGAYLFSNLPPCTYTVTFGTPTGYTPSPANQGLNDAIDSDPIGGAVSVPLALGENNTTVDAGFFLPGSIGNFVWSDNNNNGIQDGGEPGIAGVTVTLTGCGLSLTTTTDVNGAYLFSNLPPCTYTVTFGTPTGYTPSPANQGLNDAIDSDPIGGAVSVPLALGENNTTVDAGFFLPGSIGNFVWSDNNNNGIQDGGEPGIAGVTVTLTGCGLSLTTTTDVNGAYLFSNLPPCTYTVTFGTPTGYTPSPANQGGNDATDSDSVGGTVSVALASGENNTTIDAGFFNPGSIGNFVWNDLNHNGIQDTGEPGIPGVTVTLTGCSITMSTTTNLNGAYLFSNLPPCTYTVTFSTPSGFVSSPSNQGSNDAIDSDSVGGVVSVTLGIGQNNLTIDAGYYIVALQGCTLGYWKNHTNRWCDSYRTCDRFGDVFTSAPASLANLTLLQALNLGGGGIYNLARQGVAALLNTCSNQVAYAGYGDNTQSVIAAINLAYSTGGNAPGILGSQLDVFNNSGCPLGGTRATTATNCTSASTHRMSVTVYPNPTTNNFNIDLSNINDSKIYIVVYDMLGRLVDTQELDPKNTLEIKVGAKYPTGIYNVVVTQGTEVKTQRVIKR